MKLKKKESFIYAIIASFIFLVMAAALYFFLNDSSTFTLKETATQPGAGTIISYKKGTELYYDKEKTCEGRCTSNVTLSAMPLYLESSNSIVLPKDMIYVNARSKQYFRANHFSVFASQQEGIFNDNKIVSDLGFLYDGESTYIFLEKTQITINGEQKQLDAFSSIYVNMNSKAFVLYESKTKKITTNKIITDTLEATCADYKIDLKNGVLINQDKNILLYNNVDDLDEMK
ncbi:MAG: hypothetical protein RR630_04295 [Coprobacillus sp.]